MSEKRIEDGSFDVAILNGAIVSLKHLGDAFPTDYILPEKRLGDVIVRARGIGETVWQKHSTEEVVDGGPCGSDVGAFGHQSIYEIGLNLECKSTFAVDNGNLQWQFQIRNIGPDKVEIGDLAVPLWFNDDYVWDQEITSTMRVFMHSFVSGHGTFIYWLRPNSVPPYLLMTPIGATSCEYWDMTQITEGKEISTEGFNLYIHSKAQEDVIREKNGSWRQPHTGLTLSSGEEIEYGFRFQWVSSYQEIRDVLLSNGQFDVEIVPGLVIPREMTARMSVRTHGAATVIPEFPGQTVVEHLDSDGQRQIIEVQFSRLGENTITLRNDLGKSTILEFFITEPIKTMIEKRAAFLTGPSRHEDDSVWWDGLISDWNMESHVLLGPEHLDRIKGWREYMASCDDPGLGKAPFVALKNVEYPDQVEIAALDRYIDRFVWGGLQMTDNEPHPFAIYGIPNWKRNRESDDEGPGGKLHIWRIYDYPHVALLYWAMFRLRKLYPHLSMKLSAAEYLRRAGETAIATFTIPAEVKEWSAYQTGLYNELMYSRIIEDLEHEGLHDIAHTLTHHWHQKIRFFILENPSLYGSEYPFDSTGFESMHEFARYAVERARQSDDRKDDTLDVTESRALEFMEKEIAGNIFCRGWLEPAYYIMGSDLRSRGSRAYTLSYMSQMGGWGLLNYALYYAEHPFEILRLAYASALSSWALMNTGTEESDYGYWYPSLENDGAAGGGFEPAAYGHTWLEQPHGRGSWYYSCEIDLGFSGGLRCACTVLADDPVFGMYCYGGDVTTQENGYVIAPRDGVHRRFHMITKELRFHLLLNRDGFDCSKGISVTADISCISFTIENRCYAESGVHEVHKTHMTLQGLPLGLYKIQAGSIAADLTVRDDCPVQVPVDMDEGSVAVSIIQQQIERS